VGKENGGEHNCVLYCLEDGVQVQFFRTGSRIIRVREGQEIAEPNYAQEWRAPGEQIHNRDHEGHT
jgi:hypothetical protein